ncbi:MAG: putative bifunctional diguanylate cyclase/phosphodiesterase [Myxococcota bacterium]
MDVHCSSRLERLLQPSVGQPFRVDRVSDAGEALDLIKRERRHVLFIDLRGRGSDRLTPLVQTREVLARLPIIVLSDRDDRTEALQALRFGAQDYLTDAFDDPPALRRSLRHALERHRLVAELLVARHRAQFVATHDALTQLPNRTLLHDQLGRSIAHASRTGMQVAVLFLDLDRFKTINDTLGHAVGDELLVQVAERLTACTRRADMVARIGGDEFVVMTQGVGRDYGPATVAEKILRRMATPFVLNGREYWIGGSIGISMFPRDGTDVDVLLRNADAALYQAKGEGRNRFRFYDDSINASTRKRMEIEHRLRAAIEHDEVELYYQPKVEIETGRITGAEALMRWTDPQMGRVPPDEFVPVAEESGLIHRLGEWTLRAALAQLRSWRRRGLAADLSIMVNVSAHQIATSGLNEMVSQALWESDVPAGDLTLEVTEGALIQNEQRAAAVLGKLQEIGVSISLDDFGTGFSSLNYLKRIPVDTVKIDRSFVRDLNFDPDDAAIVAAILSIARQLDLNVVAEGVETLAQREFLRERHCPEIQGFLYSPPLDAESFAALLARGVCEPKPEVD